MILNLTIGGDWGCTGHSIKCISDENLVDHVRVSKRSENFGDVKVIFQ